MGLFCPHGSPLRDCLVAMLTPEQWEYHYRVVISAISRRPDIKDYYLDIGCRIKSGLIAKLQKLVDAGDLRDSTLQVS